MRKLFLATLVLIGLSLSAQDESIRGKFTAFESNENRNNRAILSADDKGAYIQSIWGSGGTDAITFRNSGGASVMILDENDKIGIGTMTPNYKLEWSNNTNNGFLDFTPTGSAVGSSTGGLSLYAGGNRWLDIAPTGNVGIGTSSPQGKLHVSNGDVILQNSSSGYPILWLKNVAGDNTVRLDYNSIINAGDNLYIRSGASHNLVLNDNGGNVGIGTSAPSNVQGWDRVLDVHGRNHSKILATSAINNVITGIFSHASWKGTVGRLGTESNHDLRLMAGYGNDQMTIKTNGNVGIGCTAPDEKLVVNGTIKASEIKVVNTSALPCSDYVFEPDYNLRSLEEVESFVKENKHLPEVPSAAEFKENGYSIGEMDDVLLRKIEELTLYMIELKKQNEQLQKEVRELKNK